MAKNNQYNKNSVSGTYFVPMSFLLSLNGSILGFKLLAVS